MSSSMPIQRWNNPAPVQITPEEQIKRLVQPFYTVIHESLDPIIIKDLIEIITAYYEVDPNLTRWYTGLKKLNLLPKTLPELPSNYINLVLNGRCFLFNEQNEDGSFKKTTQTEQNEDGSFKKTTQTNFLFWVPGGLTIRQIEKVFKAYCQTHPQKDGDTFTIVDFYAESEPYSSRTTGPGHWELITLTNLPGSKKRTYCGQDYDMPLLPKKTGVKHCALSVYSLVFALFLYKLETGEALYPEWTMVQEEPIQNYPDHRSAVAFLAEGVAISFLKYTQFNIGYGVRRLLS